MRLMSRAILASTAAWTQSAAKTTFTYRGYDVCITSGNNNKRGLFVVALLLLMLLSPLLL